MNFYKHYIGDFQRDTGHLSLTERGAYLALIHHYYATELPLPNDHAALCRIAGAITKEEQKAVKVAMGFFEAVDSGLMHSRIEAELEKAGKRADTNRRIALEREERRRLERTQHETCTNRAHDGGTNRGTNEQPIPDTRHQTIKHSSANADFPARFPDFWTAWPSTARKVAKAKCAEVWKRKKLDAIADQILGHVEAMRRTQQWQDGYEPAPLTYLNQKRWEDGVVADAGTPANHWEGAI